MSPFGERPRRVEDEGDMVSGMGAEAMCRANIRKVEMMIWLYLNFIFIISLLVIVCDS